MEIEKLIDIKILCGQVIEKVNELLEVVDADKVDIKSLSENTKLRTDETELDEETTCSELHLVDAEENSFYVLSLSAYDDIYEGDVVSAYALPIGETSFENVTGGTTLAIMLAGCYIEKIEG